MNQTCAEPFIKTDMKGGGLALFLLIFAIITTAVIQTREAARSSVSVKAGAAAQDPFLRAESIEKQIVAIESKVWTRGEDL